MLVIWQDLPTLCTVKNILSLKIMKNNYMSFCSIIFFFSFNFYQFNSMLWIIQSSKSLQIYEVSRIVFYPSKFHKTLKKKNHVNHYRSVSDTLIAIDVSLYYILDCKNFFMILFWSSIFAFCNLLFRDIIRLINILEKVLLKRTILRLF